jgi:chaperonin GroEL
MPLVCNDGETIAKEFDLKDPEENLGAQMLRQAAEKTGDSVGDGTSTSTILAHAMFADGLRNVVAGASAIDLKRGLDRAAKSAIDALRAMSRPVKTRKEKAQVATISAHNDPTIGELVAEAMEKVGGEGVITVEESKTTETTLEVVEGMQFDRGYLSPYTTPTTRTLTTISPGLSAPTSRSASAVGAAGAAAAGDEVAGDAVASAGVRRRRQHLLLRRAAWKDVCANGSFEKC